MVSRRQFEANISITKIEIPMSKGLYILLGPKIIFDVFQRSWEKNYEKFLNKSIWSVTVRVIRDFPVTTSISSTFIQKIQLMGPNINKLIFNFQCFESHSVTNFLIYLLYKYQFQHFMSNPSFKYSCIMFLVKNS